ncbi:peroxisomal biogenesis factor 11-domain-containing protein [Cladorrhinum sp. PSN259]|nr:peroxisomal biogenesis factor 11-domain-containing protein [Cladorrhinum sp. PSN259]
MSPPRASSSTLQQFIRFSTDAYGLERLLRLLQSTVQILASYPLLPSILAAILCNQFPFSLVFPSTPKSYAVLTTPVLLTLRRRLALGRRYFRVFRFLEAFDSAHGVYVSTVAVGLGVEGWLEVLGKMFNGMYLLLESATLVDDLIGGEGGWEGVWGVKMAKELNVEGQRFWFFSLLCGIVLGVVRLWNLRADKTEKGVIKEGEKTEEAVQRRKILADRRKKKTKLTKRLLADLMDLAGPGKVVGWVPVDDGVVGLLMLASTWLTGMEVWERCGMEVVAAAAAAAAASPAP